MTWRQIFEGLASLPVALKQLRQLQQVGSVQIAHIGHGDAIVIHTEAKLSEEGRRNISNGARAIWPDVKVIVLDSGFEMRIVSRRELSEEQVH